MVDEQQNLNAATDLDSWDKILQHPKLGELMVQRKKITVNQLYDALKEQEKKKDVPLGQILLEMNIVRKDELVELLELQTDIGKMLSDSFNQLKNS